MLGSLGKHIGDLLAGLKPSGSGTIPTPNPNKNHRLVSSLFNRRPPEPNSAPLSAPNSHLVPSEAEFQLTKNEIESHLQSSETSEFGSFPLMAYPDGQQITVREAFQMMTTDRSLEDLVIAISRDAAVWGAMMSNKVIQNYSKTGEISSCTPEDNLPAQEETSSWDPKKSTRIIRAIMDEIVGKSGACSVTLNDESKRGKLQLAFLISTVIFLVGLESGREMMKGKKN